ncbi:integron integrase [Noviherbaspirillum sp.]|uniref:integron integrase n=1 Tax=Noviherbaspirillum sp. TaxID=1926288 RepID=UPI002FE12288
MNQGTSETIAETRPRLLDQLRRCIREKHCSLSTERTYVYWAKWYIRFHGLRHPADMGPAEIRSFLSYLNNERQIAGSTYSQALCALLFLYKEVLGIDIPWIEGISRPKRPPKLPVVLTQTEMKLVLDQMSGIYQLVARMLYGTGMRLLECAQLRIKDIDLQRREVLVRDGKGGKDRVTILSLSLVQPVREQIGAARAVFEQDRSQGRPGVMLPYALERKYPKAATQPGWFWLFPSDHESTDPRSGIVRRHHLYPQTIQRAVKRAVQAARLVKPASTHTFLHSFATHLLEAGYDIRTVQDLLGHTDVSTTMIYLHVLNKGGRGIISPVDRVM